jgi:hypothetical protein
MFPSQLSRALWQWQPTLTAHDPSPPITLEDVPAPSEGQPAVKRMGGVANAYSNSSQGSRVW